MDVIDLNARRTAEDEPNYVTCPCGEAWFELRRNHPRMPEHGAVLIRLDGTIAGYGGTPHCVSCGKAVTFEAPRK